MDLALRDIKRNKGRFLSTIAGVGFLLAIVLAMNGIFRGFIYEGLSLINDIKPDLWVVERYRGGPFNELSKLPEDIYHSVEAIPGVVKASPFITYTVERKIGGKSRRFDIIGYDVFGGLGGPKRIVSGRNIKKAHYEMVADEKLGVHLEEKIHLGLHEYTVVGITKGAISAGGNPLVYLSLHDAQEVLYQQENEALRSERERLMKDLHKINSYQPKPAQNLLPALEAIFQNNRIINAVLVKLSSASDPLQVAKNIENWLYLSVYTTDEERQLMLKGRLSTLFKQLFLFRALLILVSTIIIALVVYTFTLEKIRSIATLKLIGSPNLTIIRLVMEQSLIIAVASFLIGLILIHLTHDQFPRRVLLVPMDEVVTFFIVLWAGILASFLGIYKAMKTSPAQALGG